MKQFISLANSQLSHPYQINPAALVAVSVMLSLLVATASTYWLERPIVALGKRMIRKRAELHVEANRDKCVLTSES